MYVKENTNEKINFIDENDVFLGYDMGQCCCEEADYFLTSNPEIANATPELMKKIEAENENNIDAINIRLDGYVFDTTFCKVLDVNQYPGDESNIAYFRCVKTGSEDLFVVLMNSHNGYYYHGFDFTANGDTILSDHL